MVRMRKGNRLYLFRAENRPKLHDYDPNDPTNHAEYDAYVEHEKHEPIAERAEDLGNREPWWIWALGAVTLLAFASGVAHLFGAC